MDKKQFNKLLNLLISPRHPKLLKGWKALLNLPIISFY